MLRPYGMTRYRQVLVSGTKPGGRQTGAHSAEVMHSASGSALATGHHHTQAVSSAGVESWGGAVSGHLPLDRQAVMMSSSMGASE